MTTRRTTPIDDHEVFNLVTHEALRRDLVRLSRAMAAPLSADRRIAIAEHMTWVLDALHHHHTAEDEGVWPAVLARNPDARPLLEAMEAEHEALAEASDGLRAALGGLVADGSEAQRRRIGAAVETMQAAMLPHLEHEETEMMPVVLAALTEDDWDRLEKEHFRSGMGLADSAYEVMWVLDDLDDDRARRVRGLMPTPVLWLLRLVAGRRYARTTGRAWARPD